MKIAIMQPYFFPYIGYWQLMNAVDIFVIFDDVNYIKRGWINRNRILLNGTVRYFNLPLRGSSQNKLINEIMVDKDPALIDRNLMILKEAYRYAPFFNDVYSVIKEVLNSKAGDVASYIEESFNVLSGYLGIKTKRIRSSSLKNNKALKGESKIIDICKIMGADHYINAIGGIELYHANKFQEERIKLSFLKTHNISYKQFENEFLENLSIIDVMMFNSTKTINGLLQKCDICEADNLRNNNE